ncbi:hypothetical protein [Streptomyces sp. UH6]|uniref:hypothetical protein n=1 Tax=Streptomyces sp. UH6 TaxID=2748379 RepID=UPI0015D472A9|nr:hypothetical protein [Streptomyces sp. UH6]NYV76928.1 hypothetical protein [Streptomyces sp. UH6]
MDRELEHLFAMTDRELDLLIAHHLVDEDFGSREDDEEERIFITRRWFLSLQDKLRGAICGRVENRQRTGNPEEDNKLLVAAIIDALAHAQLGVDIPITVLAVKIARVGVQKICQGSTES